MFEEVKKEQEIFNYGHGKISKAHRLTEKAVKTVLVLLKQFIPYNPTYV